MKHRVYKIYAFFNETIFCRDCKLFHLKVTCTSCTDEVREKVSSFKKVTLFYDKTITQSLNQLTLCLFEDVTGYRDIRRINLKSFFFSIELVVFATQQHKTNTFSRLIIKIQL